MPKSLHLRLKIGILPFKGVCAIKNKAFKLLPGQNKRMLCARKHGSEFTLEQATFGQIHAIVINVQDQQGLMIGCRKKGIHFACVFKDFNAKYADFYKMPTF